MKNNPITTGRLIQKDKGMEKATFGKDMSGVMRVSSRITNTMDLGKPLIGTSRGMRVSL